MMEPDFPRSPEELDAFERLRSRMNVGRLLVRWRMRLGLTQEEVARRAGTKQSRISEIETLQGNVRFDTLDAITRAVGLEITLRPRSNYPAGVKVTTVPASASGPSASFRQLSAAGTVRLSGQAGTSGPMRPLVGAAGVA